MFDDPAASVADSLLPSLDEVLALPAVQAGRPQVVGGHRNGSRRVRWVHVCEQPDLARFVDSGDLVLTSGMGLQAHPEAWLPVLEILAERGASGVLLEAGLFFDEFPEPVVDHIDELGLTLGLLTRPSRFVDITHSVHRLILSRHTRELERVAAIHASFNKLNLRAQSFDDVLRHASGLLRCSVVLEDLAHRLIAFVPAGDATVMPASGWAPPGRFRIDDGPDFDPASATLSLPVGTRDERWGWLVLQLDREPTPADRLVADRTADALALQRLLEGDHHLLEWKIRESLLDVLYDQRYRSPEEARDRCRAHGFDMRGRLLVGGYLRMGPSPKNPREVPQQARRNLTRVNRLVQQSGLPVLAGHAAPHGVRLLLVGDSETALVETMTRLAEAVAGIEPDPRDQRTVLAFGTSTSEVEAVRRSCNEAVDVADAARTADPQPFYRLNDVRLQGFLQLLVDDSRLHDYVERQLRPLLAVDEPERALLIATLRCYLDVGRNKASAARALQLSRPTLYGRLDRAARLLDVDVDDPGVALSLQFALHAVDARDGDGPSVLR